MFHAHCCGMTSILRVSGEVGQLYVYSFTSICETLTRFMSIVTKTRAARMPVTAKLLRSVPWVYSALTPGRARYFHDEYTSANATSANAMTHRSVVYQKRASARHPSRETSTVVIHANGH